MKIAPVADIKARFSSYLDECQKAPVIVTRNGRPTAVLVQAPEDGEDLERLVLAHTPQFQQLVDAAEERIRRGGGMEHDAFWRAVEEGSASEHGRKTTKTKRRKSVPSRTGSSRRR